MRVGLIVDEFNPVGGGAERWTARFATHLVGAGHDVHVIGFRSSGPGPGVTTHLLPETGGVLSRARAVEAAVRHLAQDMVLHDSGTSWSGHVFHPQTGSRLLSMEQEIRSHVAWRRLRARISPRLNWRRIGMARIEQLAAANAARVIAVSRRIHTILEDRHRLPLERLAIVGNGVDTSRFSDAKLLPLRDAAREAMQVGDAVVCLMVAHNLRLKGLDTALRALAILRGQGVEIRMIVVGGLPDTLWRDLTKQMGLADHVAFVGDIPDIERYFAAADIMLHPTRWDACSLATIEGMAACLPVVTTAMNGAADLITHGHDGFILRDPEDHATLATHIEILLDQTQRRRIGEAARARAVGADIKANCNAVEAILAEVAMERQKSRL